MDSCGVRKKASGDILYLLPLVGIRPILFSSSCIRVPRPFSRTFAIKKGMKKPFEFSLPCVSVRERRDSKFCPTAPRMDGHFFIWANTRVFPKISLTKGKWKRVLSSLFEWRKEARLQHV